MGLIVQKYGGTSVKDAERVMNVARRITDAYKAGNNVVVAVSAQGDTTDDLIEKAKEINAEKEQADIQKSTRMPQSVKWICCFQQVSKFQFLCLQWQ